MKANQKVINFIDELYIPKSKLMLVQQLLDYLEIVKVRTIDPNDHHSVHMSVLQILTKGKGKRETFDDYRIIKADFDNIGKKYALVYIYSDDMSGHPVRMDITSPRNTIIY